MHLDLAPFALFARAPRGGGVDTSTILGWAP